MQKSHYKDVFENQDTLWWYQGMREINESLLKKYLPQKRNLKILDAGCGPGAALIYLREFGDVVGVDISDEALKYAKKRGKVKKGDIASLPFKDKTFDVVFCFGVLYHIWVPDEKNALREFYRVLKNGGILLLEEPALNWLKGNEDLISLGKKRFGTEEIRSKLEDVSFQILKLSYINFFLLPLAIIRRFPEITGIKKTKPASDIFKIPTILNYAFFNILRSEAFFLRFLNFPIGMDLICIAKK